MGFSVADISQVGNGIPDLLIGKHGLMMFFECKSPKGRLEAAQRLRSSQSKFALSWKGGKVIVAYSAADAATEFDRELKCKTTRTNPT